MRAPIDPASGPDEDLVARHLQGSAAAFDEIVNRYERRVFAVALRMCGDPESARDVTQEVFLSALRALRTFRGEARLSTWLHRVAVNASLDHLRRVKRAGEQPLDSEATPEDRSSATRDPEAAAVAADRAREVRRAIGTLSPQHRAVVVLHDLQGLDYAEVATALDIPLGTVKSRIHRARSELARVLGHLKDVEPEAGGGLLR